MDRLIQMLKRAAGRSLIGGVASRLRVAEDTAKRVKLHDRRPETGKSVGASQADSTPAKPVTGIIVEERLPGKKADVSAREKTPAKRWRLPKLKGAEIREVVHRNCSLIKTVPQDMIPGIERRVKRIYEGTSTPETLGRYLTEECGLEDWQADRIVKDQMIKYDAFTRVERMKQRGVTKVRWIHGGAHNPRHYHMRDWDGRSGKRNGHPNGLNGFEFDLDDPPVIDEATGERGLPGQLINCGCRLEVLG